MFHDEDLRCADVAGLWANQTGSQLELLVDGAVLGGFYYTAVGAARRGKSYPLVGWRDRRCLGFSVSWGPDSESLTSWTGLIVKGEDGAVLISAMWLLVSASTVKRDGDSVVMNDSQPWEAFRTQSATFHRVNA